MIDRLLDALMPGSKKHSVLLITYTNAEYIGTVADHVAGLKAIPNCKVEKVDCASAEYLHLDCFNVIILHYSLVIASDAYISPNFRKNLSEFKGLKIIFIQDEYRWIDATAEAMRDLGIAVVFSVIHPDVVRKVYHHPWFERVQFEYTLTGFVPDHLADVEVPPYADRPIDVGYRARKLRGWFGRHAEQKYLIAERWLADPKTQGLTVDIATDEASRLYGNAWIRFISNCKAVLGTESGASVCDFTGEIQKVVEAHIKRDPAITDDELRQLYFADVDEKITIAAISPRVFEAAALRTLMIMYPGQYSDVLEAGRHYVLLEPDHSNIDEVLEILHSPERAGEIIENAFQEIVKSGKWSHKALAQHVGAVIQARDPAPAKARAPRLRLAWYMAQARTRSLPRRFILWAAPAAIRLAGQTYQRLDNLPAPLRVVLLPTMQAVWRGGIRLAKAIVVRRS